MRVTMAPSLARAVSEKNAFAAVQYPFNLIESEVLTHGVAAKAKAHNLVRFSNRPLNAVYEGKLQRIATFPSHEGKALLAFTHIHTHTHKRVMGHTFTSLWCAPRQGPSAAAEGGVRLRYPLGEELSGRQHNIAASRVQLCVGARMARPLPLAHRGAIG
jgi:hypothetical protein